MPTKARREAAARKAARAEKREIPSTAEVVEAKLEQLGAAPSSPFGYVTQPEPEGPGLDRHSAAFLFAYLDLTGKDPDDLQVVRAEVAAVRAQPWLWAAIRNTDFLRFGLALPLCGRPLIDVRALQTATSERLRGLPELAPPPEIEAEEDDELAVGT